MRTEELILQQVKYLRSCNEAANEASANLATAQNALAEAESKAGFDIYSGIPIYNDLDEQIFLSNDTTRKFYVKDKTVVPLQLLNDAKQAHDDAERSVEVERSVLSALKEISRKETIDDDLLAKYDITDGGKTA